MKIIKGISFILIMLAFYSCQTLKPIPGNYFGDSGREISEVFKKQAAQLQKKLTPELVLQQAHGKGIEGLEFSPDDKRIASCAIDGFIKIWNAENGKLIHNLDDRKRAGTDAVKYNALAFSPDGNYILSGGKSGMLKVWDIKSGKILRTFSQKFSSVECVDYSPDGKNIAGGGSGKFQSPGIWNLTNKKLLFRLIGHKSPVHNLSYSPNGKFILTGSLDKTIRIWDAQSGKLLRIIKGPDDVSGIAISSDSTHIAASFDNGYIKAWNVKTGAGVVSKKNDYKYIQGIQFSPDGKYIYYYGHEIHKISVESGKTFNFNAAANLLNDFHISNDGTKLVTGDYRGELALWSLAEKKLLFDFKSSSDEIQALAISPDGQTILSGGSDSIIKLWDHRTGRLIKTFLNDYGTAYCVGFSPDGKKVIAAGANTFKQPIIWDRETGKIVMKLKGHTDTVESISYSPDGRQILSAGQDKKVKLWDASTGKLVRTFSGPNDANVSAFSPDGKLVIAGFDSGVIKVWNRQSGKKIHSVKNDFFYIKSLAFSPNGKYLYFDAHRLKKMALSSGDVTEFKRWYPNRFALSHNGKYILGRNVILYDALTGEVVRKFKGHKGSVRDLKFSHDDKTAFTCGTDGTIRYWDVETGKQLAFSMAEKNGEWVVITPSGHFDKSQNFNGLYWVRGMEILNLDQFFDDFYKPGILAHIIAGDRVTGKTEKSINKIMASPPPTVKIVSPKAITLRASSTPKVPVSQKGTIEVVIEIADNGGGIKDPTLFHNGKPVNGKRRGLKKKNLTKGKLRYYTFNITLLNGKNTFRAIAKSRTNVESAAYTAALSYEDPALQKPNAYMLIVGINNYKNPKYSLNYGRPDAEAISSVLQKKSKSLFNRLYVTELFDKKATKKALIRALDSIAKSAGPKDVFILYYAGHGVMVDNKKGVPHFYIAPYGVTSLYKEKIVWEHGISAATLTDYSKKINARKQLLIMDACQAGGFEKTFAMRGAVEEKALKQLSRSSGLYLLAATQSEQFATEFASLKHGVFTYAILAGLTGEADGSPKDGKTTVRELSAFIEDRVPGLSKTHRGTAQYPSIYGRGQDFPILLTP